MTELLVYSGLPGSGKSTEAKLWVAEDPDGRIRINYDDMRLAWYGPSWVWNRKEEEAVKKAAREQVQTALKKGLSVCIDNTNLSDSVRASWKQLGRQCGAEVIEQEIDTPLDECIRRDRNRKNKAGGRVGRAVIERMALFYGFIDFNESDRPIAVFDIDGTLANCSHRVHHIRPAWPTGTDCPTHIPNERGGCNTCGYKPKKNWPAFYAAAPQDEPIKPIVNLAQLLAMTHRVVLLSGRDTSDGIMTEDWLSVALGGREDIGRPDFEIYTHLFLRQAGDHRQDFIHKLEILDFMPKDKVELIFEDRNQCVTAFREKGYRVLQVGPGDF